MESHAIEDGVPEPQTAQRRVVELPLEMHHYIIGFLDNETNARTILNCALVCRRWFPYSQGKLYYRIRLDFRRQWLSFKRLVLQPPSSIAGSLPRVRELHIRPSDGQYFDKERTQPRIGWGKGQERPWAHIVLNQCATQLDGLTRINFEGVIWTRAVDLALSCGSNYRSLTTLELSFCTFTNVGQLALLMTAFPALDNLRLGYFNFQSSKPLSHVPKARHSLTRLDLNCTNDDLAAVAPWLARAHLVRHLACLHWWYGSEVHWQTITEAIDGSGLQELHFNIYYDWQVDLARFPHLKTLKLPREPMTDEVWNLLDRTLSSISSSRLEELSIRLYHDEMFFLDSAFAAFSHLNTIEDILAHPQFARLRHVELHFVLHILVQTIPNELANSPYKALYYSFGLEDPQHPLRPNAELLVRRRIQEGLKQLCARDILDLRVRVWPKES